MPAARNFYQRHRFAVLASLLLLLALAFYFYRYRIAETNKQPTATDWPEYNGGGNRNHYSALTQITKDNVKKLKLAWGYSSGGADTAGHTQMQCNPVIVDGILYGVSADIQAFALDAATGKEKWKTKLADNKGTLSRGITYYSDDSTHRVFFGAGQWLYALDALTGMPVLAFGDSGRINLKKGIEREGADNNVSSNTPNTIYKNLIITGARVSESETALLGDVRAYDVHSGQLVWTFRTIPEKGDTGYNSWPDAPRSYLGGANAWAGMAIDRQRGIVYIPTGSAAFDFYGANRRGNNLFANCLLALDAATGKRLWHFQLVHHDIWDRDPPAPPNLVTVMHNGKKVDAVAQITKQGFVFLFNRVTGEPLFPVMERPFPQDAMPGEWPSPTQPIPDRPLPFTRQSFTARDINPFAAQKDSLLQVLAAARTGTAYLPVTDKMTIFFPGTDGGAQWGGAAADEEGILYVPSKEIACYTSLVPAENYSAAANASGANLYQQFCASCHGADKLGNHDGSIPALLPSKTLLKTDAALSVLQNGRGMMPSFSHLPVMQRKAIVDFVFNHQTNATAITKKAVTGPAHYKNTGYNRWYDGNGYPVNTPPWGTLTAVD
ncbi:MAG TPA: c-type cytochrome, partial [Chitinophagaceae bacterium]|nr:c-type cytochrome [Chitinophagaceae bacterium]